MMVGTRWRQRRRDRDVFHTGAPVVTAADVRAAADRWNARLRPGWYVYGGTWRYDDMALLRVALVVDGRWSRATFFGSHVSIDAIIGDLILDAEAALGEDSGA